MAVGPHHLERAVGPTPAILRPPSSPPQASGWCGAVTLGAMAGALRMYVRGQMTSVRWDRRHLWGLRAQMCSRGTSSDHLPLPASKAGLNVGQALGGACTDR